MTQRKRIMFLDPLAPRRTPKVRKGKHTTLCSAIQREDKSKTLVTPHQMALTNCILARNNGDESLMTRHPLVTLIFYWKLKH